MSEKLDEIRQQLLEEKGIATPSKSEISGGIVKSSIDELKSFIKTEIDGLKVVIIQSENSSLLKRNRQLENEVATLKAKVEKLENSLIDMIKKGKNSTAQVSTKQPSISSQKYNVATPKAPNTSSKFTESRVTSPKIPKNTTKSSAVVQYNNLITLSGNKFKQARDNFWNTFDVKFFSCSNSGARMNDPNIEPIFNDVSTQNGDYWALPLAGGFEVFPKFGAYNDNLNNERAMGIVFDSNFQAGKVYEKVRVEFPAKFRRSGTSWILESKGTLFLE